MADNNKIIGYQDLSQTILDSIKSKKMGASILFLGPRGIGKHTLIKYLLSQLLLNNIADPDLIEVSAEYNNEGEEKKNRAISTEEIRNISVKLRMTAVNNRYRVAIIDGADYMNYNASNALLKILEEPGDNTLIFLTANSSSKIIPTIRSRCRVMKFNQLNEEFFSEIMMSKRDNIDEEEIQILYKISDGNIGLSLSIYDLGAIEYVNKIQSCLDNFNYSYIVSIANFAIKSRKAWEMIRSMILYCLQQNLVNSARANLRVDSACLEKTRDIGKLLYDADNYHLDQSKIIMACFL